MKINKTIFNVLIITLIFISNLKISYAKSGSNLNVGDYIKYGHYYGEQILWRVLKDDDINHRVMLVSDRILMLKAFDASGYNGGTGKRIWNESNIRDWLNSEKDKLTDDDWTHEKPIYSKYGYNNYDDEAGFLSNFSEEERNVIVKMNDVGKENEDGNKVTLLTVDELPLLTTAGYENYKANPTKKAVEKSEYKNDSIKEDKPCYYWTRTPDSSCGCVRCVSSNGSVSYSFANYGYRGVRPVLWLDTSIIMLDNKGGSTEEESYTLIGYGLDTQKPKIINNRLEENILRNSVYGEEEKRSGIIAIDDVDGDITSSIEISGDIVDITKLGNYTIRYNVKDGAGNKANEVIRIVHVLNKLPAYNGYEVGTSPKDRRYFKYYIGLDKREKIRCMMVCADGGNNTLNRLFNKQNIIDLNTYKFKDCYYINRDGKIKKYQGN